MPGEHLHNFMRWTWAGFRPRNILFCSVITLDNLAGYSSTKYQRLYNLAQWYPPLAVISAPRAVGKLKLNDAVCICSISATETQIPLNTL